MLNSKLIVAIFISSCSLLVGCGTETEVEQASSTAEKFSISFDFPDSLTGGQIPESSLVALSSLPSGTAGRASINGPCGYSGLEDSDTIFDNGFNTTRYMISMMASWTCIADLFIDIVEYAKLEFGGLTETDNDTLAANYDNSAPTHFKVTYNSSTNTTVHIYYGYDRLTPPTINSPAGLYISWNRLYVGYDGIAQGRMIIDSEQVRNSVVNSGEPVMMRMDFNFTPDTQKADMFIQFDDQTEWVDGMRIDVTKDLTASPLGQVYTTRGLIEMDSQFFNVPSIKEVPLVNFYTVSDQLGNGAVIQDIQDMSLSLMLNAGHDNNLGNYLFTKRDVYFFKYNSNWEYINKTITTATYKGGRSTPGTGGVLFPFNPSLDIIISAMNLDPDYFMGDLCGDTGSSCTQLLNAVYRDGFAGQQQNIGIVPNDWRANALLTASNLESLYPNGFDWNGAFDMTFYPDDL